MNLRTTDLSSPAPVSITPEPVAPTPGAASNPTVVAPVFSVWRSLRLGPFHIGSSLTDLLTSAVWNRILIVDLGVAAWPVALLTALRYLLAPLTLWAGHQSDSRPLFGSRRVAYIWLGQPAHAVVAAAAAAVHGRHRLRCSFGHRLDPGRDLLLFYGVGTLISGAPFLALIHDSAPYARRSQAIAVVETVLVASFAFGGFLYGRLLPTWNYNGFWRLVLFAMAGAAFFLVRLHLAEKNVRLWLNRAGKRRLPSGLPLPPFGRIRAPAATPSSWELRPSSPSCRTRCSSRLAVMFSVFPSVRPTRFNAYWGTGVLLAMVLTAFLTRRWRPDQQVGTTAWGLVLLGAPILVLALASFLHMQTLLRPVLLAFGAGFGIFTVGGVSLLMAMNKESQAGSYLALWSVIQLVTRGAGIAMGGVIRDVAPAHVHRFLRRRLRCPIHSRSSGPVCRYLAPPPRGRRRLCSRARPSIDINTSRSAGRRLRSTLSEHVLLMTEADPTSGDLQQRILDEAARLFITLGYGGASMRKIAAAVGVSKAALYYHFEDKEALLLAIIVANLERIER